MMERNKLLSKAGFYYYNLLVFITRGNKRFIDKKLIFGALIIGLTSQSGCKSKNTDNITLVNDKDSIRNEEITCYDSISVDKTDQIDEKAYKKSKNTIRTQNNKVALISSITCYLVHEDPPEFPGGDKKRIQFIKNHLKYPQIAKDNNIEGLVYTTFVVGKDGKIYDVKVLRGLSKECDEEAIRLVKLMPKWKTSYQDRKPVPVQCNMPIKFSLDTQGK
ncbi:MAG: energy transducer TonB [Bacteroidales bacterium]